MSPGDTVSAGSSQSASSASSSSSASSGTGGAGAGLGGGGSSASGGSASGGSSSSAFIVLVDLSGMDLVVPFSESDVTKISVGQPATVTVNALPDSELAAHVTSISTLSTTNASVVSYDVTFHLDQLEPGIKPGMTASAQVVIEQAVGAISVPSSAITGSTVIVRRNGKDVTQPVVTGIVGDTTTQVISGLQVGDQIVIRTVSGLGSSATGAAGGLGGAAGAGGAGIGAALGGGGGGFAGAGGGGFGGGGGGARFFRGGG